jgi:tripartite-type tricarboxylate transporter receptor subunit TctC
MKFIFALALSLVSSLSMAKESYTLVVPNTVGSASDIVIRTLSEVYNKNTGNKLIIQNVGGGNQAPAAVRFSNINTPAILLTTTGIMVFNPLVQKNLPYSLDIFDHVGGVALSPVVWVVRADSPYQNMQDLVSKLPSSNRPLVAYANLVEVVNLHMIARKNNWSPKQVEPVKYKGVPEVVQGLLANDLEVAVVSTTQAVIAGVESGKLRIIGTTVDTPLTMKNTKQEIIPVTRQIDVEQFTGGIFLSLNKLFTPEEAKKIKQDLMIAMRDPAVLETLDKLNQIPFNNARHTDLNAFFKNFKDKVDSLNLKFD